MNTGEQPVRIIGNESNMVYEIEPGRNDSAPETTQAEEGAKERPAINNPHKAAQQSTNDLATNDGAVVESLDTAFHQKPGVAKGLNSSGSSRAGYYEEKLYGQSDAQEEANLSLDK